MTQCERQRKFRNDHPGYQAARMRDWRRKNPDAKYRYDLKANFGLTWEQYQAMLHTQNYACAICGRPATEIRRRLSVDHNHQTGKVRGILCPSCNLGIARLEIPGWVDKALTYLKVGS